MTDYNFLNLSPPEFEELARDLLQRRENIILESFKVGTDNGIDFREPKKQIIVQVKRYKDDFKYFYNALKREVPKVEKNKPKRYILVTSVRLSPKNKEEIYALFKPFIKDTADIIGGNDLNNLLSIYPDIEEMHLLLMFIFQNLWSKMKWWMKVYQNLPGIFLTFLSSFFLRFFCFLYRMITITMEVTNDKNEQQ